MSRTITALFDSRADAEAGRDRLVSASVDASNINIHDQGSIGATGTSSTYSTHQDRGIWGSIKNAFLPDEDRHTYEEGVRRGGVLLTADIDGSADDAGRAVDALEGANSVDIDERAGNWRSQGWDYDAGRTATTTASSTASNTDRMAASGEEHIPIVEEQLVVGKREVNRGGVRVRSYVTERPVQEQVRLREEHVNIERRPVNQPLTGNVDAFQEREINMTATSEEAVVGKTARVVEEVVIGKTSDTRTEQVNETVRKTEVEIDQLGDTGTSGRQTGGTSTAAGTGTGVAATAAGLGKEALGNVKQAIGGATGNDSLKQSGLAQERAGEAQQGKPRD